MSRLYHETTLGGVPTECLAELHVVLKGSCNKDPRVHIREPSGVGFMLLGDQVRVAVKHSANKDVLCRSLPGTSSWSRVPLNFRIIVRTASASASGCSTN
jgi:hypothetical protein